MLSYVCIYCRSFAAAGVVTRCQLAVDKLHPNHNLYVAAVDMHD